MSEVRPNEFDPSNFREADRLLDDAQTLGAKILSYAESLAADSTEALRAIGSRVYGTGSALEEEWPLTGVFTIQNNLVKDAERGLARHGILAEPAVLDEEKEEFVHFYEAAVSGHKYDLDYLQRVYGDKSPVLDCSRDLIKWADAISERGWPVMLRIDLNEAGRVSAVIYRDTDVVRSHFDRYANPAEAERDDGVKPDRWVSQRTIVSGEDEMLAQLQQ